MGQLGKERSIATAKENWSNKWVWNAAGIGWKIFRSNEGRGRKGGWYWRGGRTSPQSGAKIPMQNEVVSMRRIKAL